MIVRLSNDKFGEIKRAYPNANIIPTKQNSEYLVTGIPEKIVANFGAIIRSDKPGIATIDENNSSPVIPPNTSPPLSEPIPATNPLDFNSMFRSFFENSFKSQMPEIEKVFSQYRTILEEKIKEIETAFSEKLGKIDKEFEAKISERVKQYQEQLSKVEVQYNQAIQRIELEIARYTDEYDKVNVIINNHTNTINAQSKDLNTIAGLVNGLQQIARENKESLATSIAYFRNFPLLK